MRESPEMRFFKSPTGTAVTIAASLAALGATIAWMRRARGEERRQRQAMVAAATAGTGVAWGYVIYAQKKGYFKGGYFELPLASQIAMDGPLAIASYTLMLNGYRALTAGSRHPYWIWGFVSAAYVPLATRVGEWERQRGYFKLGRGFSLRDYAPVGMGLMAAPVAFYEGFKRLPALSEPEPEFTCARPAQDVYATAR